MLNMLSVGPATAARHAPPLHSKNLGGGRDTERGVLKFSVSPDISKALVPTSEQVRTKERKEQRRRKWRERKRMNQLHQEEGAGKGVKCYILN